MAITINGKVYRTLEEQVLNNQEDSNAAVGYARDAQDGVAEAFAEIAQLRQDLTTLENSAVAVFRVSEAVKAADGTVVPSAVWDGEVNINTQVYDIYCTLPLNVENNSGNYVSSISLSENIFGSPKPIALPSGFESSGAKEILYSIHTTNIEPEKLFGFNLSASPLVTNGNFSMGFRNGLNPWQSIPVNICIHVHGRLMG